MRILIYILAAYLVLVLLIFLFQKRLVWIPGPPFDINPGDWDLAYEDVRLTTADGVKLHAWYVPSPGELGTVLFFHGNAGHMGHRMSTIRLLRHLGLDVMIFDYRGYGNSEGTPDEEGSYLDGRAAIDWLEREKGLGPEQLIYMGRSLGGGVATRMAEIEPPRRLILESTFTSIPDMAAKRFPWLPARQICVVGYDSLSRVAELGMPKLFIHSSEDDIISFSHGRDLFDAAAEPKQFLEINGDHNSDAHLHDSTYQRTLAEFVRD